MQTKPRSSKAILRGEAGENVMLAHRTPPDGVRPLDTPFRNSFQGLYNSHLAGPLPLLPILILFFWLRRNEKETTS